MPNSSVSVQSVVDFAKSFPDISSSVQIQGGGKSLQPALTIATDVMTEMVAQVFNWKWNRFVLPLFYTNSWQQDYALNVINLGWLEDSVMIDINNTQAPQPTWPLEVVKYLPQTSNQWGQPSQVCWLPNDQLVYATWGAANTGGGVWPNPQPGGVIATPIGVTAQPSNPLLQVKDAFGNLWVVTTFGVSGVSNPFASNLNPIFPTPSSPTTVATTATDGSVVWTAVNPKGQGVRCSPLPPQTGVVYQFNLFGQWRPFTFTNGPFVSFSQTIEPIPDDFAAYFRRGFVAMAYEHSEDKNIRAKANDMKMAWMKALNDARVSGDRERDNAGFYPSQSIMGSDAWSVIYPGPAYPFQ